VSKNAYDLMRGKNAPDTIIETESELLSSFCEQPSQRHSGLSGLSGSLDNAEQINSIRSGHSPGIANRRHSNSSSVDMSELGQSGIYIIGSDGKKQKLDLDHN
jgi:hypothetical protein